MAWRSILLVFLLNLALLGSQTVALAESDVLANFLDGAGQTLEVAGATAKDLGRTAAGTALSRAGNVASVGEAAVHAKNGNLPATVGSLVELGVGVFTVPGGAAAGTTVAPGPGTVAGAYGGSIIAKHAGNQAKKLVQDTLDKYGDKRSARQKRMEKAGLDRNAFADNYDKPLSGHMAEFNADLNRELIRLEAEQALKAGRSYYPDPALLEEIAAYDRLSKEASGSYSPLALGSQSAPENSEEISANPEPGDPEETEGSATSQACGPMSEDEKAWIIANKDSNFENYLVGLEGSRTNLKNMTTHGGYFKPDVDGTRAWVAHAENRIAEMLEEARSALGSCPQAQTQACGALTDDEKQALDSALGQSPEEFEQSLEQSRRYLEDFRVSYTQFKNEGSLPAERADAEIQYVETSYKEAVKRYENAINKLSSRQGCPPYQLGGAFPQSGSTASPAPAHQDRQSAENDSQTGGNNTNYASEDENLPAGFRRVGPNTCVNNISDFIRC